MQFKHQTELKNRPSFLDSHEAQYGELKPSLSYSGRATKILPQTFIDNVNRRTVKKEDFLAGVKRNVLGIKRK